MAGFGHRARAETGHTGAAAAAALFANLGSLALFAGVVGAGAPQLLRLAAKSVLAFPRYGWRVATGLLAAPLGMALAMLLPTYSG